MNCGWIILLLLFCGSRSNSGCGQTDCGCEETVRSPRTSCREPEPCPCEDSRFEPRFEQRPHGGNGTTCGCEGENN